MFRLSFYAIAFATILGFVPNAYAFDIGSGTSAVRDRSDPQTLTITIQLKGMNPTDRQTFGIIAAEDTAQVQQAIANTLDICLSATATSCSETDVKVRWALVRQPIPQVENAYLSNTQIANFDANGTIATQDVSDINLYEYVIKVIIKDTAASIDVGSKALLRFFPDKVSNNGNKDNTQTIKLGSGVQNAVSASALLGTPKSLIVQFSNPGSVTFMDSSVGVPGNVVGILFPKPVSGQTSFPTYLYTEVPSATPTPSSCTLDVAADETSCSITCENPDSPQTIDFAEVGNLGLRTASSAKDNLGFTDVTVEDGPYAVVLQYLPEGTKQTCLIGNATDAATLVQLSGGHEPSTGDPNCFIATAAYGSALDPHINVLRWFRDAYLLKTPLGKSFVRFYYRNSPPIADWIRDHEWARTLTRGLLWAPVLLLESLREHRIVTLSFMLLLSLAFLMRQRRRRLSL